MKDDLGKRMKEQYEQRTRTWLPRRTYTIIRLDGKAFHTFTKKMKRPYDKDFMLNMDRTAMFLCKHIQGAKMAYVQSDEISILLTDFDKITTDAWFDGQVQKIVSVSASLATGIFNALMLQDYFCGEEGKGVNEHFNEGVDIEDYQISISSIVNYMPYGFPGKALAFFDSRVFCIPDPTEVENYFVWRQKDAMRNSISMHAQSLFSHKELHGKSQSDMHDMIHDKGENWDKLPDGFKRGRTIYKDAVEYDEDNIVSKVDWAIRTPDFLKEREDLSDLIPKINEELTD